MKKIFALLMSVLLTVSMAACGEADVTADAEGNASEDVGSAELVSDAVRVDNDSFLKECSANIAKAGNDYEGKNCIIEGFISEIQKDHIVLYYNYLHINVFIPTEQIIELQTEQYIEVAGTLENLTYDMYSGAFADLTGANVSKDTFEISGEYHFYNSTDGTHPQDACIKLAVTAGIQCIDDSNIEFVGLDKSDENIKALESGTEITVEGKLLNNYWDNTPNKTAYVMSDIIIK